MRRMSHIFVYAPFVSLIDLLLINSSFVLAFVFRWGRVGFHTSSFSAYMDAVPEICSISLLILYVNDLYSDWLKRRKYELLYSTLVSGVFICISTMAVSFWLRQFSFPRANILGSCVLQVAMVAAFRLLAQHLYWWAEGQRRVIVIGPTENSAVKLIEKLEPRAPHWMLFSGCCAATDVLSLEKKAGDFDAVMLTPRLSKQRDLIKLCDRLGKEVMVVPAAMEMSMIGATSMSIDDVLILTLQSPHLGAGQAILKRASDIVISSAMLIVLSPVILLTAIFVKFSSKGPVIFKQDRVGRNGVEYTIYKFRTMIQDAEKHTGPVLAQESDPRITRVGAFLRSTRLDELPQLFNVLIGNMSMVGPRPERRVFVSKFKESVPGYDLRHSVKPGITGLAQVAGSYSTSVERKLRYDLLYIYNYSLVLDFRIIIRTILVVLHKEQAKGLEAQRDMSSLKQKVSRAEQAHISELEVAVADESVGT